MKKILVGAALVVLSLTLAGCPKDPMVPVCINKATFEQVDNDFCEDDESEYDPTRYGVVYLKQSQVRNQDSIMEDDKSSHSKKKAPTKAPAAKSTKK